VAKLWRPLFALCGILILAGGPRHPGGTMAEMLAHPDWVPSHGLMLAGFVALLIGLLVFRRLPDLSARMRRWTDVAIVGTVLQVLEMAFHTAAYVDLARLESGTSTPVLTTHIWLTILLNPVFAATMIAFIEVATWERALGSRWISWIGVLGALCHGLAAILVAGLGLDQFRILFPGVVLLALWLVLAALWPRRARVTEAAA
jgi:hypothetical protein